MFKSIVWRQGLGLTAAKMILDSHRARISARKNDDIGTEFLIRFPLH